MENKELEKEIQDSIIDRLEKQSGCFSVKGLGTGERRLIGEILVTTGCWPYFFRGKNVENWSEWVRGIFTYGKNGIEWEDGKTVVPHTICEQLEFCNDSHENKFHELDFVKADHSSDLYMIRFDHQINSYVLRKYNKKLLSINELFDKKKMSKYSIVGNLIDNPEMIRELIRK